MEDARKLASGSERKGNGGAEGVPGLGGPVLTAKAVAAKAKLDFDLHVALIMRQDGVRKTVALFSAWAEGPVGLERRAGPAKPTP